MHPSLKVVKRFLSDQVVLVTKKRQIIRPSSERKKRRIKEGTKVLVKDSPEGVLIKPISPIEDLAGVDAGKLSLEQMRHRLDEMRAHGR